MWKLGRFLSRARSAAVGPAGEKLAALHLKRQGFRILGRNLRNRFGEIDLLAEAPDRRTIVVVEVKATRSRRPDRNDPVSPEVHVNRHKQRQLVALACQVARAYHLTDRPIRFDVVGVDLAVTGRGAQIRHHEAAFESHV